MLPKMRYRLALDLGSTSIGWCVLRLDPQDSPIAIVKAGVRIFSDGRNPKDGASLAVTRREARQARRRRDRVLKRKQRMMDALIRLGFFPADENARRKMLDVDPYFLRKKGLKESLSAAEFARALFHLNQRRGFKSNRVTDGGDSESGVMNRAINDLRERLARESCETLGEWLANRHAKGESVRARLRGKKQSDKAYDFYADRSMVEQEFDALWRKQKEFDAKLYSDESYAELRDILRFQRPLKPVSPGRCTLLPEEERAPLALPMVQRFRIYQEVNNLRYQDQNFKEIGLTLEQRDKVVELLEKRKNATFQQIRRELRLPESAVFNLEDSVGKRSGLNGNMTSVILSGKQAFGPRWYSFDDQTQDRIVEELLYEQSQEKIIKWLGDIAGVDQSTAETISNIRLPQGYGNLSRKAIVRILPQLQKEVITYDLAVRNAELGSHSALSHTEKTGEIMDSLPYYGIPLRRHVAFEKDNPRNDEERFGKIANPTVHIGLNQLRKVVNAVIEKYGHPSEVVVEVARELKQGQKKNLEIQQDQKKRQDRNEKHIAEACSVLGISPEALSRSQRREISQKMQLWVELNPNNVAERQCPYTGEQIGIEKLLSSEVEIEHILPFSRTLDDSMNNKTVSLRRANREKGNMTPDEAFAHHSEYCYEDILKRASVMPRAKAQRFAPDAYQKWLRDNKDFLARALNDTAYFSRIAKEYLSLICPPNKVWAIPGSLTATLRGKFGLDGLLSGSEKKNRNDHRHHAIDAAVIGVTDRGLLQKFSNANASAKSMQLNRLVEEMPLPWPTYREHVQRAIDHVIVSFKPDHGYQRRMHEDSAWGLLGNGMVRRYKLSDDGIRVREIKNQKVIEINSTNNRERHGLDQDGNPKAYKGYVGGSNYCIEICKNESGKWEGEVVPTFNAYQLVRKLGEPQALKKLRDKRFSLSGKELVMRLQRDDMVKMKINDQNVLFRVVTIRWDGQVSFAPHSEANVDARNRDKNDSFKYISKMPGALRTVQARKVSVSEIGELRDSGFKD